MSESESGERKFLRHTVATLAYRYTFQMGKIDWGVGTFVTALPVTLLFIFILIKKVK